MWRLQQCPPKRRQAKIRIHWCRNPVSSCRREQKINLILIRGKTHLRPIKLPWFQTAPNRAGGLTLARCKDLQQSYQKIGQFGQRPGAAASAGKDRWIRVEITDHKTQQEAARGNLLLSMLFPQVSQQITPRIRFPIRNGSEQPGIDYGKSP